MLGSEWEEYKQNDEQKYIILNNKEILDFIEQKEKEGIHFVLNVDKMQSLIDKIALFFEFKYPETLLIDILYSRQKGTESIRSQCLEISKSLDIEQLKYQLHHDYILFLEYPYWHNVSIRKDKKELWELSKITVRINDDGIVEQLDLEKLKENNWLKNIEGINTASDLLGRLIENTINVDYSNLDKMLKERKANLQLRNMILKLIPLKILYSSLPQYGYPRAKSFIRMFNQEYGLNMDSKEIEDIIENYPSVKREMQKLKGDHS